MQNLWGSTIVVCSPPLLLPRLLWNFLWLGLTDDHASASSPLIRWHPFLLLLLLLPLFLNQMFDLTPRVGTKSHFLGTNWFRQCTSWCLLPASHITLLNISSGFYLPHCPPFCFSSGRKKIEVSPICTRISPYTNSVNAILSVKWILAIYWNT